jgi:hypothetical protein
LERAGLGASYGKSSSWESSGSGCYTSAIAVVNANVDDSNAGLNTAMGIGGSWGQTNWRWCQKCQGLVYGGNVSPGACPAGGRTISQSAQTTPCRSTTPVSLDRTTGAGAASVKVWDTTAIHHLVRVLPAGFTTTRRARTIGSDRARSDIPVRTSGSARTNHIGPKTSVKDRQIRGSLENCCASASDPKIKLRRIWLLRTHSSRKGLTSNNEAGQRAEIAWSKRQKRNLCPQNLACVKSQII